MIRSMLFSLSILFIATGCYFAWSLWQNPDFQEYARQEEASLQTSKQNVRDQLVPVSPQEAGDVERLNPSNEATQVDALPVPSPTGTAANIRPHIKEGINHSTDNRDNVSMQSMLNDLESSLKKVEKIPELPPPSRPAQEIAQQEPVLEETFSPLPTPSSLNKDDSRPSEQELQNYQTRLGQTINRLEGIVTRFGRK